MRIGVVSKWCNRGQAAVSRYVRLLLEEAGHETYVLARPNRNKSPLGRDVEIDDPVWKVPRITYGSKFKIPTDEYIRWVRDTGIDVLFCDMNLQFEEIAAVRAEGVKTIGRFVWERFNATHAEQSREAYDVIYSLHRGEQERYGDQFGIDSPLIRFGCFPDARGRSAPKRAGGVHFVFHGGMQGPRKPIEKTIEAFRRVEDPSIRLIIKSQAIRSNSETVDTATDSRVEHVVENMRYDRYHDFFSSCHVSLSPSRWEGLGVHLFEAIGYGMPTISNDIAPIRDVIEHGRSGLLVRSSVCGSMPNGLEIYDPDVDHLAACIAELSDPERLREMERTTAEARDRLSWEHTRHDYLQLLASVVES